jgi:flavin-dependent dehydrogenase
VSSLVERGVLHGRSDRGTFTPFLIPIGGPLSCPWRGRVLFTGDAGGFVHATTAEGIYYAMASGELAASAIVSSPSPAKPESAGRAYDRAWRAELGAELRDAVLVQRYLFASHSRVARAVRGASSVPAFTAALLEFVRGERSYGSLRRSILLRFPGAALRMVRQRLTTTAAS